MADVRITVEPELSVDGNLLRVLAVSLQEGLSVVGSLVCEATAFDVASVLPEPKAVAGKPCELSLKLSDGSDRRSYHGIVVSAERFPMEHGHQALRITVAPRLWKLGRRADCRIFQELSVPDIVKKVLTGGGAPDMEWKLDKSYPARTYVVQYRETDLELVCRLLAEEGIWFAVRHDSGKDVVFFCDDPKGSADAPTPSLGYRPAHGHEELGEVVSHLRRTHRVRPDKVTLRDYDFERPKLKLEATKQGKDDGPHALEVYAWPGRFTEASVGERYAQVLLDAIQAERDVVEGHVGVLSLAPGLRVGVDDHPYAPLNATYLVTGIDLELSDFRTLDEGDAEQSHACRFRGVPTSKTDFRPARRPVAKKLPELQTAFTTGPSGSEIHVDGYGRVKAQYHWDRLGKHDEHTTTWMRTVQLPTGGAVFLPRMDWEVAVRCFDGDVDRPVVLGRLYDGIHKPPYALPAGKARGSIQTATTPGGGSSNEMRTDDTKGKEQMFWNASKDMTVDVGNNETEAVGNNSVHEIGNNHKLNVTNSVTSSVGADQTITIGANQTMHVQQLYSDDVGGSVSTTIGANRNMKVGGDAKKEISGSAALTVGAIQTDLVVGSVSESTPAAMSLTVGAAMVELTAASRATVVGGMRTETAGAAKVVVTKGGYGVQVGGAMTQMVGGAIVNSVKGNKNETASATYTEIAAGAQIVKAENITFEAEGMLSLVMGGSTILITPALIAIAGASVKADGDTVETVALILDN